MSLESEIVAELQRSMMREEACSVPAIVIIGAMKAGTTWLYSLLCRHPGISPCIVKEPRFFTDSRFGGTWQNGLNWYRGLFALGAGATCEASTSYTKFAGDKESVERMYLVHSTMRLIYIVRNPIDRAISHYLHSTLKGREKRSIHSALLNDYERSYITVGQYYKQLLRYLAIFPREQICVVVAESLWANPSAGLQKIFSFLGLDPMGLNCGSLFYNRNSLGDNVRSVVGGPFGGTTQQNGCMPVGWHLARASGLPEAKKLTSSRIAEQLGFTHEDRSHVATLFEEDVFQLRRLLGCTLDEWSAEFALRSTLHAAPRLQP